MNQADYEATSERMEENAYQASLGDYVIYLFHIATYDWATDFVAGHRVLDFGTGTGYGAARLAAVASSVTGVDVAGDAVAYARDRYTAENLDFAQIQPVEDAPLPFPDASFDVVTSFQVIEHVPSPRAYLAEAKRVLKPGGTLLVVTPDRTTRLFGRQRPWNIWHLHEFWPGELRDLVAEQFSVTGLLGMSAPADVVGVEIARSRKLRLATLPFTFPKAPEPLRQRGLGLLKTLQSRTAGKAGPTEPTDYGFGPEVIEISATASPSINIVVTATNGPVDGG